MSSLAWFCVGEIWKSQSTISPALLLKTYLIVSQPMKCWKTNDKKWTILKSDASKRVPFLIKLLFIGWSCFLFLSFIFDWTVLYALLMYQLFSSIYFASAHYMNSPWNWVRNLFSYTKDTLKPFKCSAICCWFCFCCCWLPNLATMTVRIKQYYTFCAWVFWNTFLLK